MADHNIIYTYSNNNLDTLKSNIQQAFGFTAQEWVFSDPCNFRNATYENLIEGVPSESGKNDYSYLAVRGYIPGKFKRFVDEIRRPKWFKPDKNQKIWQMPLVGQNDCLDECLDNDQIRLTKDEDNKLRSDGYRRTFIYDMKPNDIVVVGKVNTSKIKALGIIGDYHEPTEDAPYYKRSVCWKYKDKADPIELNFSCLNTEKRKVTGLSNHAVVQKKDIKPCELIDLFLRADKNMWESDVNHHSQFGFLIGDINGKDGDYKDCWGKVLENIRPDGMNTDFIQLESLDGVFYLPKNLYIFGTTGNYGMYATSPNVLTANFVVK